jgi:hypothetical protein
VIRTALVCAIALAAASPALALEHTSVPAPKGDSPRFLNFSGVAHLLPDGAAEPFRFGDEQKPKGDTVIVEVAKGKSGARVDVNDPRQNPFMAGPERKAAPAQ